MNEPIWHLNTAEGAAGPYTAADIAAMLAANQISEEWYVWREGFDSWCRIADTAELAPSPATAILPPPVSETRLALPGEKAETVDSLAAEIERTESGRAAAAASPDTEPPPPAATGPAADPRRSFSFLTVFLLVLLITAVGAGWVMYTHPELLDQYLGTSPAPTVLAVHPDEEQVRTLLDQYLAAMTATNAAALRALVGPEKAAEFSGPEADTRLRQIAALRPSEIRAGGVNVNGEQAIAILTGVFHGEKVTGSARLRKISGRWKLSEESWKIALPAPRTDAADAGFVESDFFDSAGALSGELRLAKQNVTLKSLGPDSETLRLATGWCGNTDLRDPRRAVLEFRGSAAMNSRRFEVRCDVTRQGPQRIDGDKIKAEMIAEGGQIFPAAPGTVLTITAPYTGKPDGILSLSFKPAPFASAGYAPLIGGEATVRGAPTRPPAR